MDVGYDVDMVVRSNAGSKVEEQIKRAIDTSGGHVEIYGRVICADGDHEHRVRFRLENARHLGAVLRAVERIRGAGVTAVSEPKPM